jgi:hypothetical protein
MLGKAWQELLTVLFWTAAGIAAAITISVLHIPVLLGLIAAVAVAFPIGVILKDPAEGPILMTVSIVFFFYVMPAVLGYLGLSS